MKIHAGLDRMGWQIMQCYTNSWSSIVEKTTLFGASCVQLLQWKFHIFQSNTCVRRWEWVEDSKYDRRWERVRDREHDQRSRSFNILSHFIVMEPFNSTGKHTTIKLKMVYYCSGIKHNWSLYSLVIKSIVIKSYFKFAQY